MDEPAEENGSPSAQPGMAPKRRRRLVITGALAIAALGAGAATWRIARRDRPAEVAALRAAARSALEAGDAGAAVTFANAAVAADGSPASRALLGEALVRAGRHEEGLRALEEAAHGDEAAALALAQLRLGSGDTASASRIVERVILSAANGTDAHRIRAAIRLASGDTDGALADLAEVVDRRPDDAASALLAGQVATVVGRFAWDETLLKRGAAWLRAAEAAAEHARTPLVRAAAHVELGLPAEALADLAPLPAPESDLVRCVALSALGRDTEAEMILRARLRAADTTSVRVALVRLLTRRGHLGAAEREMPTVAAGDAVPNEIAEAAWEIRERRATSPGPQDLVAAALRSGPHSPLPAECLVLLPLFEHPTGRTALRARLGARGPTVLAEIAREKASPADVEALRKDADDILAAVPGDAQALAFRAAAALVAGRPDESDLGTALDTARRAGAGLGVVRRILLLRALVRLAAGAPQDARADASAATSILRDDVSDAVEIRALAACGRTAEARALGVAAFTSRPGSALVAAALADVLDADASVAAGDPLRAAARARVLLAQGDVAGALESVRAAGPAAPGERGLAEELLDRICVDAAVPAGGSAESWDALATRAALLRRVGERSEARAILEDAVQRADAAGPAVPLAIQLAELLADAGEPDAADAVLARALKHRPDAWDAWTRRIDLASMHGRTATLQESLHTLLSGAAPTPVKLAAVCRVLASPGAPEAAIAAAESWGATLGAGAEAESLLVRGHAALARGRCDDAVAFARDPALAQHGAAARVLATTALLRAGRIDDADAELAAIPATSESSPESRAVRSAVDAAVAARAFGEGRPDEARRRWFDALVASPGDLPVAVALARTVTAESDVRTLRTALDDALGRSPAGPVFHGAWLRAAGRPAEALPVLRDAAGRDPSARLPAAMLVDTAILVGDAAAATEAARRFAAAGGEPGLADLLAGRAAEARIDRAAAESAYRRVLARHPADLTSLSRLVQILVAGGRAADARTLLAEHSRSGAASPARDATLAGLLTLSGATDDAIGSLDAVAAPERDARVEFLRARCLESSGDADGAAAGYDAASARAPGWAEPRFAWMRVKFAAGRGNDVSRRAERDAADRPRDPVPWCMLAAVAEAGGKVKLAEQRYRKALDVAPQDPVALNNLAWLLCEDAGMPHEALPFAARARTASPAEPSIADTYGWVLFRTGAARQAVPHLRFAAGARPGNAGILCRLAQALAASGDAAGASAALDAAERAAPGAPEAKRLRSSLGL